MKKFALITLILLLGSSVAFSQYVVKQIAYATKSVDSLIGGAPSGGTTKYYYYNNTATVGTGLTAATSAIDKNYSIYAIEVAIGLPTKAADIVDSCQITFEISFDNANWVKWSNAGATTAATQTQYLNGGPKVFGSGVYTYAVATRDMVTTTTTAGGAVFMPLNCIAPYSHVKITAFKASASAYPAIRYILKKL